MINCNVKEFLAANRITVAELARNIGVNRSTITALRDETAARVELKTIEVLCRHFGCTVGEMFELGEERARSP